jgi:hypothetical protein
LPSASRSRIVGVRADAVLLDELALLVAVEL